MNPVRFSSVTQIKLKNWPGSPDLDRNAEKKAEATFNQYVADYLSEQEKQHASDPNYRISAFTLRPSFASTSIMPRVLVLDNDGEPHRDQFIQAEFNERERVIAMALAQISKPDAYRFYYEKLSEDSTTPAPKSLDWNAARDRLWNHWEMFMDIAHTNALRQFIAKTQKTIWVDGGLPAVKNT